MAGTRPETQEADQAAYLVSNCVLRSVIVPPARALFVAKFVDTMNTDKLPEIPVFLRTEARLFPAVEKRSDCEIVHKATQV